MHFTIDSQVFRKTLSRVSAILSARSKDYNGFNLGMANGRINVSCSNGTEAMRESIKLDNDHCDPAAEGYAFVSSDHLVSIVNKEKGLLHIELGEKAIAIKSEDAEYALGVSAPKMGFKDWPKADSLLANHLLVDSRALGRALSLAGVTDSFETYKTYAMDKLALDIDSGKLRIYTTDPRRMVVAHCELLENDWHHAQVLLPDQSCAYAMSIFPEKERESSQVRIGLDGSSVIFSSENRTFIGRQVVGRIPDPIKFYRLSSDFEFRYPAKELLSAFQRINTIVGESEREACHITLENDRLIFKGAAGEIGGRVKVELVADNNGMRTVQCMSPRFAVEFLRRLHGDEEVLLGFSEKLALVELRCKGAVCMIAKMTP